MSQNPYQAPTASLPARPSNARTSRWRHAGLLVACCFFAISLFSSTLETGNGNGFLLGLVCLLFGWGSHLSWYANPPLLLAGVFLLTKRPGAAAISAAVAIALMLTALQITETYVNEAGTKAPVTGYGLGFYLWIGSGVALLITALASLMAGPSATSREP